MAGQNLQPSCIWAGVSGGGAFTAAENGYIGNPTSGFACVDGAVKYNAAKLNIAPNSTVDRNGETDPVATAMAITLCP